MAAAVVAPAMDDSGDAAAQHGACCLRVSVKQLDKLGVPSLRFLAHPPV